MCLFHTECWYGDLFHGKTILCITVYLPFLRIWRHFLSDLFMTFPIIDFLENVPLVSWTYVKYDPQEKKSILKVWVVPKIWRFLQDYTANNRVDDLRQSRYFPPNTANAITLSNVWLMAPDVVKQSAGFYWFNGFFSRHLTLSVKKAENLSGVPHNFRATFAQLPVGRKKSTCNE